MYLMQICVMSENLSNLGIESSTCLTQKNTRTTNKQPWTSISGRSSTSNISFCRMPISNAPVVSCLDIKVERLTVAAVKLVAGVDLDVAATTALPAAARAGSAAGPGVFEARALNVNARAAEICKKPTQFPSLHNHESKNLRFLALPQKS